MRVALLCVGHRAEEGRDRNVYRVVVPGAPDTRHAAASFRVERSEGVTKIGVAYGMYVKGVSVSAHDPVDAYNTLIGLPFLKTTIAIAFGFEPIPTPWRK